jgi:hypothetical protein
MTAYRINIDGRVYEGDYGSAANAVYGAMLYDENQAESWTLIDERELAGEIIGVERLNHNVTKKIHRVKD